IDHDAKLASSFDNFLHDLRRHGNRRRSSESASLAIRRVSPATQKRVPLTLNRNGMEPAFEPDIDIRFKATTLERITHAESSFLRALHQLPISQRHGRDV